MANIKSAIKRARQNVKRRESNRYYGATSRTRVKNVRKLIDANELEEAEAALSAAVKALDKAAQKGVIHPNNAARRKSRLMKALNRARAAAA